MSSVEIRLATPVDLAEIEAWLRAERKETGEGFYCNWGVIQRGVEYDETFAMRRNGEAVAVLVDGTAGPDILSVRPDLRGMGIGEQFARWLFERALARDYSVLEIECEPRTSVSFWRKHGFLPMGTGPEGFRHAYKLLDRKHALATGPDVVVSVSLFPKEKNWSPLTEPYWVRTERGRRQDGRVQLPARVALYQPGEPHLVDCVVRVIVEGACVYEDKLKYPEAREHGIHRDPGGFYYLDVVS
jgi:GNAT superfamily N-acetyltransferase